MWYNYTGSLNPIEYPNGDGDVHYTYYGGSRLRHEMTDSTGTSHYDYDAQDRLTSYTPPVPSNHGPIEYEYNNLGQKTSMTNGSQAVGYQYYANGWLKAVTDGTNPYAEYTYDSAGNRTRVDLGNQTYTVYAYDSDPRYRVSEINHYRVGTPDVLLGHIAYPSRDSAGNPLGMEDPALTEYRYDDNSRLWKVKYPGDLDWTYSVYDWVGNRNPSTCTYNAADEITAAPGHQYTYLGTGSLEYQKDATGQTIQKQYSYSAANLLEKVIHGPNQNDPASLMEWDADGNRVSFTRSTGGTWRFVYDPTAGIPAVIEETGPVYYIREPNGSLIARIDGETINYYHFDALGSTRLVTDSAGVVTDTYSYDAWGNATHDTGTTQQPHQFVGQLGYYTHTQDEIFPVLHLGVRFYDVSTGRFTQVDAVRQALSWYAYAVNRPTTGVDPLGLAAQLKGCTEKQERKIRKHLEDIASHRIKCLTGGKRLKNCIRRRTTDVVIVCDPSCNGCAYTVNPTPRKTITLCPDAFDKGICGCLGSTILHELAHSCTTNDFPGEDPEGYECEWDCYQQPGSEPCPD